jgi:hypothetical protein
VLVRFGREILKMMPRCVSTEAAVARAGRLVGPYDAAGIDRGRVPKQVSAAGTPAAADALEAQPRARRR